MRSSANRATTKAGVEISDHTQIDPALQHSLQLALRSRDDKDHDGTMRHENDDLNEDDLEVDIDAHDEFERNCVSHGDSRGLHGPLGISMKTVIALILVLNCIRTVNISAV